jgi:hypothetical protein
MSESNNVKFVEDNGQWLWKRYDAQGSVIFRSQYFNTEREAREDYDLNGGESSSSEENTSADIGAGEATIPASPEQTQENAPENASEAGPIINGAGTVDGEDGQQVDNDNGAGTASL